MSFISNEEIIKSIISERKVFSIESSSRNIFIVLIAYLFFVDGLIAQSWLLNDQLSHTDSFGNKYVACPDSLVYISHTAVETPFQNIQSESFQFKSIPNNINLEKDEAHWVRIKVQNEENTSRRYLFGVGRHEIGRLIDWSSIEVYFVSGDSLLNTIKTGNALLAKDKPIRDARNLFWLNMAPEQGGEMYIKLQSSINQSRMALDVRLYDPQSINSFDALMVNDLPKNNLTFKFPVSKLLPAINMVEYVIDSTDSYSPTYINEYWDDLAYHYRFSKRDSAINDIIWSRLRIINLNDHEIQFLCEIGGDSPRVESYSINTEQTLAKAVTGKEIPYRDKAYPHPFNFIPINIDANDTIDVYFKISPLELQHKHLNPSYGLPLHLMDPAEVAYESLKYALWKGGMLAIILFQFIYFGLRALLEKDHLGLYYTVFIFGFLSSFISNENVTNTAFAFQFFFEYFPYTNFLGYVCLTIGLLLFTDSYLGLRNRIPRIFWVLTTMVSLIVIFEILELIRNITGPRYTSNTFYHTSYSFYTWLIIVLLFIGFLIAALLRLKKDRNIAGNYIVAFSPLLLIMLYVFYRLVTGTFNAEMINFVYMAFLLATILFAIIVARRNNERKRLEAQAESLITLNKAKSVFYDNITHEFRTPLTVISGLANMIKGNQKEKELIQKNSQEVLTLVEQLLEFSKSQAKIKDLSLIDDNIVPYLEYLLESLIPVAKQKDIQLVMELPSEEIVFSHDRNKIKVILNNLITNAIKFSPNNGTVKVSVYKKNEELIIKVKDSGSGMTKDKITKIFNRFYQGKQQEIGVQSTGGIGLALVKEIVEQLQGSIKVKSKKGKGSLFEVSLPLNLIENKGSSIVSDPQNPKGPEQDQKYIILIIDDHQDVRYYINRLLSEDYKIIEATDGNKGFNLAAEIIPDLVISDVMMPEKDGYALTSELKKDIRTAHIPVILITAKEKHEDKLQGLAEGADAYLTKPFDEEELKIRIQSLIKNRQQLKEIFSNNAILKENGILIDPFLEKSLTILEQHYEDERFGVREFVEEMQLSRMQVHRKLKALMSCSTSNFINQFRLQKSKEKLLQPGVTIAEVAYSCGYSDPGYFSKMFSHNFDLSPLAYRESMNIE